MADHTTAHRAGTNASDRGFGRRYERLSVDADAHGRVPAHRRELLAALTGHVVEVGCGNGLNFAHYPDSTTQVTAIEPHAHLRDAARRRAAGAPVPIDVEDGCADSLLLPDAFADAVVVSLVLCSVPDVRTALEEIRRVLRPGGELRFYEHVAADGAVLRRVQRAVAPWTIKYGGGCRPTRNTTAAIEAAGLQIEHQRAFDFRPTIAAWPMAPHVLGIARRP